jgi:glucans biosynthesis protein
MDAIVSIDSNGEILERHLTRNEVTGGWRFVVRFRRLGGGRPVELRAYLASGNEVMSETWSYILPPG